MSSHELRAGEWYCHCSHASVHSKSCLKCLRCGMDKPDPVTLARACFALGVYQRCISDGKTPAEAMQQALQDDLARRGR